MGATEIPHRPLFQIPDFTISGVLPPFIGASPTHPAGMSPYPTTLTRIATKMCGSSERKDIFRGLIAYRQQLANLGMSDGFQWLSGSFMEDIENLETRPPNDIDVVTFFHRPMVATDDVAWKAFVTMNAQQWDRGLVKSMFKCDVFFVDLNTVPSNIVNLTRYWFGLFSHRRGGLWKGLLQIPLNVTMDDSHASEMVVP